MTDRRISRRGFFSTGYVTFYPAGNAVSRKMVEVVAQSSPPRLPKRFRRPKATLKDGAVESWVIEGGWRDVVKQTLTDEERRLPIAEISDHEFLRDRSRRAGRRRRTAASER